MEDGFYPYVFLSPGVLSIPLGVWDSAFFGDAFLSFRGDCVSLLEAFIKLFDGLFKGLFDGLSAKYSLLACTTFSLTYY